MDLTDILTFAPAPNLQLVLGMPNETPITALLAPLPVTFPSLDILPGETAGQWRARRREQMKELTREDRQRDIDTLIAMGATMRHDYGLGSIPWKGDVGVLKAAVARMGNRVSLLTVEVPSQGFTVRLYMDDLRKCPIGWHVARTVKEAIAVMSKYRVEEASLDHDMGACQDCLERDGSLIHCGHIPDGEAFVRWMVDTGIWPVQKPKVHSMNPDGRAIMEDLINTNWRG